MMTSSSKRLKALAPPAALVLTLAGFVSGARATVELNGNFENLAVGTYTSGASLPPFSHVQINPGNKISVITSPVREGGKAGRFEANRPGVGTNDYRRAEVVEKYGTELPRGPRERWYGGSFLLPSDYQFDAQNVIIFQMHESSNTGNPIFTLNIAGDKLGDITLKKNTWYDFVLHARWTNQNDGFVEHWINGVKKSGQYNLRTSDLIDNNPPYAKWGIYKYAWRGDPEGSDVNQVVVVWDNIKIGTTQAEVTPPPLPTTTTLINEIFNSAPAANFSVIAGGTWAVSGGKYVLTNPRDAAPNGNLVVHNTNVPSDFTLTCEASAAVFSAWDDFSIVFGYQNPTNYYFASFNENNDSLTSGLFRYQDGVLTQLSDITALITAGTLYSIKVERIGSQIKVYRNGSLVSSANDTALFSGKVGFGTRNNGASFDNLVVTEP